MRNKQEKQEPIPEILSYIDEPRAAIAKLAKIMPKGGTEQRNRRLLKSTEREKKLNPTEA